jgi:hypothetical protein
MWHNRLGHLYHEALNDIAYLLFLPIKGRLLGHMGIITRDEGDVMTATFGAQAHDAEKQVGEN